MRIDELEDRLTVNGSSAAKRVRIRADGECWRVVSHHVSMDGYVRFNRNRQLQLAHRLVVAMREPLDETLECEHTCETRNCVRPEHLAQVTKAVNQYRRRGKCGHGKDNRYYSEKNGTRCRECVLKYEAQKRWG